VKQSQELKYKISTEKTPENFTSVAGVLAEELPNTRWARSGLQLGSG
jgi:hypothetical protein